jgi:cytochrome oxidase assembly protein ShyY1
MGSNLLVIFELLIVFGVLIGFGVWQLRSINRELAKDAEQAASTPDAEAASPSAEAAESAGAPGHAERQQEPDPGSAEARER